jgi:hypothetical protein
MTLQHIERNYTCTHAIRYVLCSVKIWSYVELLMGIYVYLAVPLLHVLDYIYRNTKVYKIISNERTCYIVRHFQSLSKCSPSMG